MRRGTVLQLVVLFLATLVASANAFASTGLTYHGRIVQPNGQPLQAASVFFHVQIRSPVLTNILLAFINFVMAPIGTKCCNLPRAP